MNKKHSSKQVVSIMYTHLRNNFLQLLPFKFCDTFLLRQSKKFVAYFGLHEPFLHSYKREDQKDTVYAKKI